MTTRKTLPPAVRVGPFSTHEALIAGVSPGRLRSGDLDHTYWGVRSATRASSLVARCLLLAKRMPADAFFCHTTAALLLGIPVPWYLENDPALHVAIRPPTRAPHANGVRGHQVRIPEKAIITRSGLRLTPPGQTWCDLGALMPMLDLVAAGDYLINWQLPLVDEAQLASIIARRTNRRGLRALRTAFGLLNGHSESPQESILRALLVTAGFPEPRVNHNVSNQFGEFVARTDLILEEYKIVLEYQGDYHRTTKGQWRADMSRRARLEAEGWRVMELNADDLRNPDELVSRIRRLASLPRLTR